MIVELLSWIILGGIAGWVSSMIAGTNAEQGGVANIIVGIIGAFIGGLILRLFGGSGGDLGNFSPTSLLTAILGATILLYVLRGFRRGTYRE